jgi:phosphosulfolactate synthase
MSIETLAFPSLRFSADRSMEKPRTTGMTMVVDGLDSGWLTIDAAEQLLELAGSYIDLIKVGWLTGRFVERNYLARKLALYRKHRVTSFTGGMLLEAAQLQGCVNSVIDEAAALGFDCMEISDSVAEVSTKTKRTLLDAVLKRGMRGIVEIGRKGSEGDLSPKETIPLIEEFRRAGAYKIILESEQIELLFAGKHVDLDGLRQIVASVGVEPLIFEVPYGKFVSDVIGFAWWFVQTFGVNVNLANIEPRHALAVETVRHGYGFHGGLWESEAGN